MRISIHFNISINVYRGDSNQDAKPEKQPKTPNQADTKPKTGSVSFNESTGRVIEALQAQMQPSTIENYRTAKRSFLNFLGGDVNIHDIDNDLMLSYQRWLKDRGLCLNTVSCYMRSLRAILCKVLGHEEPLKDGLFKHIYMGHAATEKRALSEGVMERLRRLELKPHTFLCFARDMFLFSFYALGMPPIDMALLRKDQIKGDKIVYYRHKTGQQITLKIEPCMRRIMKLYGNEDSPYVFPILSVTDAGQAHRQYQQWLNRYNRNLKSLAQLAGVKGRLSAYCARHSWASAAYSANVELPVISKGLGHSNPNTTLIYLREINNQRLEKANRHIISRLSSLRSSCLEMNPVGGHTVTK